MARRMVLWYARRWGIESWHQVLKVVCGVESRQMKSAQALERALALDMVVASRVLLLSRLGKEHPALPAELFYSPEELEILELKKKETAREAGKETAPEAKKETARDSKNQTARDAPNQKLTLWQANILVAMLAGFWGRTGDGHPGPQILAEGLRLLRAMVWLTRQWKQDPVRPRRRGGPT